MGLNKSTGNMYDFITATWNTVKGACYHDCSYCYMKRWGKLNPVRFDEKELKTDLGSDNFIFVGSSCDMWAQNIPKEWIVKTLDHCDKFDNKYLFQTKNPENIRRILSHNSSVCVTIESNRYFSDAMNHSPKPWERAEQSKLIRHPLYITIEPIMKFDIKLFVPMLEECGARQINIGFDSGHNNLFEPTEEETMELIKELERFTKVIIKNNARRILK